MYDKEAIIQDADIELAALHDMANEASSLRRACRCPHNWTGPKKDDNSGEFECFDCGHVFENEAARDRWCHRSYAEIMADLEGI
jgi:hypothetical protein